MCTNTTTRKVGQSELATGKLIEAFSTFEFLNGLVWEDNLIFKV